MSIKYSFVDNEIYGTEDVNSITKDLTGAGVAPFPTQDTYSTSDFNTLTEAIVSSGTSLDGCKCTVSNVATASMAVTVAPGIIFFESGVRLTVDSDGYVISVTPNTAGYVFAHYSPALQVADVVFDTEIPTDGEYVLLAELTANGIIADKRTFARSKVVTFGSNLTLTKSFTYKSEYTYNTAEGLYEYATLEDVDLSKFNYAVISYLANYPYNVNFGVFDLRKNVFDCILYSNENVRVSTNFFEVIANSGTVYVKILDNKLTLLSNIKNGAIYDYKITLT